MVNQIKSALPLLTSFQGKGSLLHVSLQRDSYEQGIDANVHIRILPYSRLQEPYIRALLIVKDRNPTQTSLSKGM